MADVTAPTTLCAALSWPTSGSTAAVALTGADVATLLAAIAARRAALQGVQQTLQNVIAACTAVAQVIALETAAGW